jgi:hypothetical protein
VVRIRYAKTAILLLCRDVEITKVDREPIQGTSEKLVMRMVASTGFELSRGKWGLSAADLTVFGSDFGHFPHSIDTSPTL